MPYAFRAVLLVLGEEAYSLVGEGAFGIREVERLWGLARRLRVGLPFAVGTEISSSTVARTIQVHEEQQQQAREEMKNKKKDFPSLKSNRTTPDDIMALKKTVLLLEAQKLKLEIEKLRIEKDNLEMKSVILNQKISKLITSGKL
ncbi:unnamed protein product [Lampetra planeri]